MSLWRKISSWWNKGDLEAATEDARDNDRAQRDLDAEDHESFKDDQSIGGSYIAGGIADYERDSEPQRDPAP